MYLKILLISWTMEGLHAWTNYYFYSISLFIRRSWLLVSFWGKEVSYFYLLPILKVFFSWRQMWRHAFLPLGLLQNLINLPIFRDTSVLIARILFLRLPNPTSFRWLLRVVRLLDKLRFFGYFPAGLVPTAFATVATAQRIHGSQLWLGNLPPRH